MPEKINDTTDATDEVDAQEADRDGDTDQTDQQDTPDTEGDQQSEESDDAQDAPEDDEDDTDDEEDDGEDADSDDSSDAVEHLKQQNRRKNREAKKLRERATVAEHRLAQYQAAEQTGLPLSMASRLQGKNADELKKDAEELATMVGKRGFVPGAPPNDGDKHGDLTGNRPEDETDLDKIASRIYKS
ncbi:hypothetical protein [Corynebacterium sp. AOP12-C2-36]|uniref:hypothetical protein n=1 Tax=Corynebacterium sp. AOP12-C2-36 TaxID=3457723 RepID=UPI0040344C9D